MPRERQPATRPFPASSFDFADDAIPCWIGWKVVKGSSSQTKNSSSSANVIVPSKALGCAPLVNQFHVASSGQARLQYAVSRPSRAVPDAHPQTSIWITPPEVKDEGQHFIWVFKLGLPDVHGVDGPHHAGSRAWIHRNDKFRRPSRLLICPQRQQQVLLKVVKSNGYAFFVFPTQHEVDVGRNCIGRLKKDCTSVKATHHRQQPVGQPEVRGPHPYPLHGCRWLRQPFKGAAETSFSWKSSKSHDGDVGSCLQAARTSGSSSTSSVEHVEGWTRSQNPAQPKSGFACER